ncbi:AI-2E family transporter [Erwiniaceae bacterium L1_54_6]|jgi:AI-2 transport protein TqsA|nr:AI-2E family transporter [Erwiniaceae bacterium L1_54_6]
MSWFTPWPQLTRVLILLACLTLILFGLHLSAHLINQVLLALLLSIMLDPLVSWFEHKRVPRILSSLAIITVLLVIIVVTIIKLTVLTPDLILLSRQAPLLLTARLQEVTQALDHIGIALAPDEMLAFVDAGAIVRWVTAFLTQIPGVLSWWVMVFLMLLFMLYELPLLKNALHKRAHGDSPALYRALQEGIQSVIVYARVKTLTGIFGGLIVWGGAQLLGLKFAFFWGVLMFVFNYVPVLGSFMAAIPPVVQSYIAFDMEIALVIAGFFVVLNLTLSSVVEPLLVGKQLDMSLTSQLLAFLFWQAVLGITGAILAIPLTYLIKKVLLASFRQQQDVTSVTQISD